MSPLALSLHFLQAQPDSRLVALARDGHDAAFEALVRRYRKELLAYCRRLQPQTGSAEDALQQTLLQAWRALRAGAEVRDARPWLYRIAHNVTLNHLRVAVASPQEIPDIAGGGDVDQLVEHRLLARAALAGMAALPSIQRQVFVSAALDGASHDEVAGELGLSSGAVRGLIYRARATLRAAAAAITPSPAVNWAIRRAETRGGGSPGIPESLAGGGGAGVAAVLAKGGAVLTLAGTFAGAGSVILTQTPGHHRHHHSFTTLARSLGAPREANEAVRLGPSEVALVARMRFGAEDRAQGANARRDDAFGSGDPRVQERTSDHADHGGSGDGDRSSDGGSLGGSSSGSSVGSDGAPGSGATIGSSSAGSSGASSGGSSGTSGSSDGGPSGSSTSITSGSGSGTSDGGPGPSGGGQVTLIEPTSDGGFGSDGGSSGSASSSGSGGTMTTSGSG